MQYGPTLVLNESPIGLISLIEPISGRAWDINRSIRLSNSDSRFLSSPEEATVAGSGVIVRRDSDTGAGTSP